MSRTLILVRTQVEANEKEIAQYHKKVVRALSSVEGFQGMTVWRQEGDPTSVLHIHAYESVEAAEKGLKKIANSRVLLQSERPAYQPADVIRAEAIEQDGTDPILAPVGTFLSMSVRVADPGFGPELQEELDRILAELKFIDGFKGAVRAKNDVLDEEAVGLVLWENEASFKQSLPRATTHEVKLYRKLAG